MKIPEKYWESQGQQVSLPFACSLWACAEPAEKTNQSQRFFDQVATGLVYTLKVCPLQYVSEILPLYPSGMFPPDQSGAKKKSAKITTSSVDFVQTSNFSTTFLMIRLSNTPSTLE